MFGRVTDDDLHRLVPGGPGLQGRSELSHQGIVDDHVRFEVQRLDIKNTLLAVELLITICFPPALIGRGWGLCHFRRRFLVAHNSTYPTRLR
jgi:hypothetical protein